MFAMNRMTGGKMFVGIPSLQDSSSFVSPLLVPKAVEIISQVPGNIREGRQAGHRVSDITPFVLASSHRLSLVSGYVQNRRDNHIAVPGVSKHPLPLLPIRDVKAGEVDL